MPQRLQPQMNSFYGTPSPFPEAAPPTVIAQRAPTTADRGYALGQTWVNEASGAMYGLTGVAAGLATWELLGSSTGAVATLTGGSGGARSPTTGNITLAGTASQITTTGSGSTITWSLPAALIPPGSVAATTSLTATLGAITATNGNFVKGTAGNKDVYSSVATTTAAGANSAGSVTLAGGTATISTTAVTANSLIRIYRQGVGATGAAATGNLSVGTIVAATSFVISAFQAADATALQASDVSVVFWEIVN